MKGIFEMNETKGRIDDLHSFFRQRNSFFFRIVILRNKSIKEKLRKLIKTLFLQMLNIYFMPQVLKKEQVQTM